MSTDEQQPVWNYVSTPIRPDEYIPAERKVVLVWLQKTYLPFCGYIRYAAGDPNCPYFVVYHGNSYIGADVIAWCDCLPDVGPDAETAAMYSQDQKTGRGRPERNPTAADKTA